MRRKIRLSDWAKRNRMNLRTAQRKASRGELPVPVQVDSQGHYYAVVDAEQYPEHLPNDQLLQLLLDIQASLARIEEKLQSLS